MNNPYFSIITATYNSEKNIKECIDSIKSQTYRNFEHIVIDGLSNDSTIEILNENKIENQNIISEKDNGIYDALNKGISKSRGNFIVFLHSDDQFFESTTLEKIHDFLEKYKCDGLWGNLIYIDKKSGKTVRKWRDNKFRSLYLGWMPPHPTLVIKKGLYDEIGKFDTQFKIAGDYDFCVRLFSSKKYKIQCLDEFLIQMKTGGASNKGIKQVITKMKEDFKIIQLFSNFSLLIFLAKNIRKTNQII